MKKQVYAANDELVGSKGFSNGSTFSYEYDVLNRLTIVKENGTIKLKYTYDAMGRLEREDNAYSNKSYKYEYTTNGNILSKKTYAYTTGTLGTVQSTETRAYGNSNWLDQLTNINGTAITYDNMGNPLKWHNASSLTWEGRKLKTFTKTDGTVISYTYDENGIRTGKKIGSENVEYVLSGTNIVQEKRANYTLTFLYDGSTLIGFNYKAGSTNADYYYGIDNFGNINYIYDSNGNIVVTYRYDAWGKVISTTGSLASTIGAINPYRYKSYYFDMETGFYYLYSRYYDPAIGRFVNADSYLFENIQGFNIYAYCYNNPVNMIDTIGMMPKFTQEFIDGFNEWVSTPLGILRYLKEYSPKGELYEYWIDSNNVIRWGRHHTTHSNPKHHQNPHDHQWIVDDNGNNKPNGGQSPNNGFKAPNSNLKKGDDSNRNDISNIVGGAVATAAVGYVIYVGVKWIIAIAAAPATGGGSIIIAGVTP